MKFIKQILRPGSYLVNGLDGKRRTENITKSRITQWVETFGKMIAGGLGIPAPWKHDKDALPAVGSNGSKDNAGWWSRLWQEADGSLYGELDVPLDADASKVGTTVTAVSPMILSTWKDGAAREWKDAITHIALVTNPVMPGQENFHRVEDDGVLCSCFSLNDAILFGEGCKDGSKEAPLSAALDVLRQIGLDLPEDTSAENLLERIVVAGRAVAASKTKTNNDPKTPGPKEQPTPIAMSLEETMSKHAEAFATKMAKAEVTKRVEALVKSGRVTPAYRKDKLDPMVEGFQLSFNEETGEPIPTALDGILEALEQSPQSSPFLGNRNGGTGRDFKMGNEEPHPNAGAWGVNGEAPTEADIEKVANQQLAAAGLRKAVPDDGEDE